MKITKITQQVKDKSRYSVFVDEKYCFSLSELGLIESGIRPGQEITGEELAGLKAEASVDKLYHKTLNLLARRPRSEWEIKEYLKRQSDDSSQNEKILNTLTINGYIDDEDFARAWVENRRLLKPVSRRKLRLELLQKRVPDAVISEVLTADDTDEQSVLIELIKKKRGQSRYQDDLKLMQYLTRQGFRYDDIKRAFQELDAEKEADD